MALSKFGLGELWAMIQLIMTSIPFHRRHLGKHNMINSPSTRGHSSANYTCSETNTLMSAELNLTGSHINVIIRHEPINTCIRLSESLAQRNPIYGKSRKGEKPAVLRSLQEIYMRSFSSNINHFDYILLRWTFLSVGFCGKALTDGCELWCCLIIFIHNLNRVIRFFKDYYGITIIFSLYIFMEIFFILWLPYSKKYYKLTKMCQSCCNTVMFLGMYHGSNVVFFLEYHEFQYHAITSDFHHVL